jgi:hypothetical protein
MIFSTEYKFDIGLTYLPTSTTYALNKISPILNAPNKKVNVILTSQLTADSLCNSHIVYIRHLSGHGLLSDAVFEVSDFTVGNGGYAIYQTIGFGQATTPARLDIQKIIKK